MVISLIPITQAADFSFSSPSKADLNESFKVKIISELVKDYDVKIFIYKDRHNDIISKILDGNQWKNPFFYLKEAYPEKKEFSVRATSDPGERGICVRLRKTGESDFDQTCINMTITDTNTQQATSTEEDNSSTNQEQDNESNTAEDTNSEEDNSSDEQTSTDQNLINTISSVENEKTNSKDEILVLNPITTLATSETYTTQAGKKNIYVLLSFTAICILIIILLALRKL